jgi:hypothetical protein
MNKHIRYILVSSMLLVALIAPDASAQSSSFGYQGRLLNNGQPAEGSYELTFSLFGASTGGGPIAPIVTNTVAVSGGVFNTMLDFGSGVFTGAARWLELGVRTNGGGTFESLMPRQELQPSPYAIHASSASHAVSADSLPAAAVQNGMLADGSVTTAKIAGGQVVRSINGLTDAVQLVAGQGIAVNSSGGNVTVSALGNGGTNWALSGNAGTTPGVDFIGTTDASAMQLRVNSQRALSIEPGVTSALSDISPSPSLVGGHSGNKIEPGVNGAVISGGGYASRTTTAKFPNMVSDALGVVGGGAANTAGNGTAAGGEFATVPGGFGNRAAGTGSFAAGRLANSTHDGSFVWGDGSQDAYSTGPNRFEVLATGGANLYVGGSGVGLFHGPPGVTVDAGNMGDGDLNYGLRFGAGSGEGIASRRTAGDGQYGLDFYTAFARRMSIAQNGDAWFVGNASVASLTIRGGADLAEPFAVSGTNICPGAVVVIDDRNPGQLKLSSVAYDHKVAGIVSGAGGVNPGISMIQEGTLEAGHNVALSGRVYVLVDADRGAVEPGDLLTTSDTPGHAMKASNPQQASGAILGKAMTPLLRGRGLVLILVSLQ